MYSRSSTGLIVLAVLLVLATGMPGVAVADDSPVAPTLSVLDGGEIIVDEATDDNETDLDENETGDSFAVTDLDAPETVAVGESVTVTATISNPNAFETNQSVEFRLDGDVVDRQTLAIDAEENRTVSISFESDEIGVGSYIHGFLTTDRGELSILEVIPFAELEFDDQETDGELVVVDSARLSEGGFVVVYDEDDRIGVSEYLDAGDHEEIEVELSDKLDDDADLKVIVHLDTDDTEAFAFDEGDSLDRPYVDVDGEPITDSATATKPVDEDDSDVEDEPKEDDADVEDGVEDDGDEDDSDVEDEREEDDADAEDGVDEDDTTDADDDDSVEAVTPEVNVSDQESDGELVVVETAVMPVDGYVAVYEADELIGVSDYLDVDEHDEIDVDLFDVPDGEFDRDRLTENTTLTAVLHEETTGDETFDHLSNESIDGPIVDDEDTPISDEANITVPSPEPDGEDDETDVDEPPAADDEADDADDVDEDGAVDDTETDAEDDEADEDDSDDDADDAEAEAEDDEVDDDADDAEAEAEDDEVDDDADDAEDAEDDSDDTANDDESDDGADDEDESDDADDEDESDDADDADEDGDNGDEENSDETENDSEEDDSDAEDDDSDESDEAESNDESEDGDDDDDDEDDDDNDDDEDDDDEDEDDDDEDDDDDE